MDSEALYVQLGRLIESMPDLRYHSDSREAHLWVGRATALVEKTQDAYDVASMKLEANRLGTILGDDAAKAITTILYRALARAELNAPGAVRDSFIPAATPFDAMAAIGKVLQSAKNNLLIVDPYMDEKVLTVYSVLAAERIDLRLLADAATRKPSLAPAVAAWKQQHGAARPLDARLAPARQLHDRLILVDNSDAWTLTQSLNAFADRSPASIVKADAETSGLKVAAYADLWNSATPI